MALIASLFSSCSTDEAIDDNQLDFSKVDIYDADFMTPAEFGEFIGESFNDYLAAIGIEDASIVLKAPISTVFLKNKVAVDRQVANEYGTSLIKASGMWKVKMIKYTYWSTSYCGDPILLSASICVPALNDPNAHHLLSAMSLCPPHSIVSDEGKNYCPSNNGTILMARVAFNHAVVVPDYEGYGVSSDCIFSELATKAHARQLVDAGIAALGILYNEGYMFDDDFGTYNVGVSAGGGVSYTAHKIIENDISQKDRESLNLKMTFAANSLIQHSKLLETLFAPDSKVYTSDEFYRLAMNFFYNFFDALPDDVKKGYRAEQFYSKDLLDEDGSLDMNHPMIVILKDALQANDLCYNWDPKHPLVFEASTDDKSTTIEDNSRYAYELLRDYTNGMPNGNVKLQSFSTPITTAITLKVGGNIILSHVMADAISFINAIDNMDPTKE